MTHTDYLQEDIQKFIPQRPPMVMVDKLEKVNEQGGETSFKIQKENVFVDKGFLQESGMVENIAQTAAALTGYKAITEKTAVKRGFIGSVKKLEISKLPKVGDTIHTTIEVVTEVMNATVVEGKITIEDELVASCMMNIFLEEDRNI